MWLLSAEMPKKGNREEGRSEKVEMSKDVKGEGRALFRQTATFFLIHPGHAWGTWSDVCSNGACRRSGQSFSNVYPETQDQDVGQKQGGDKHFEELCREDASFLHRPCLPHAESHWTPRVPEVELLWWYILWSTRPICHPIWILH